MNEHQFDQNSYSQHHDYAFQQHLVPDSTLEHHAIDDTLTNQNEDLAQQTTFEQQNQVDYLQSGYDISHNQDANSFNDSASGLDTVQQPTFQEQGQDLSFLQEQGNSAWEQQYLDRTSFEESPNLGNGYSENYNTESGLGVFDQTAFNDMPTNYQSQTSAESAFNTQSYNSNLWEQQFQQRSGHAHTADDLNKALDLEHQAQEEQKMYENDTRWATNISEYFGNSNQAHLDHQSAAEHKQKAEDLQAEADKIRNQT